jgi:hypothetical protein
MKKISAQLSFHLSPHTSPDLCLVSWLLLTSIVRQKPLILIFLYPISLRNMRGSAHLTLVILVLHHLTHGILMKLWLSIHPRNASMVTLTGNIVFVGIAAKLDISMTSVQSQRRLKPLLALNQLMSHRIRMKKPSVLVMSTLCLTWSWFQTLLNHL